MHRKNGDAAAKALSVKREKKGGHRRKIRIAAICMACVAVLAIALALIHIYYCPLGYLWVKFSNPELAEREEGDLRVHFVDVGQGDGMIVELPDGAVMLIDGGNENFDSRSALLRYANALGVKKFDYILLTHPDSDHAGGLDDAVRCFGAEKAFIPYSTNYEPDSSFADFLSALEEKGCETAVSHTYLSVLPEQKEYFYYMMFLSPLQAGIEGSYYDIANADDATDSDENNASAVLWLEYAGRSVLFTGDIGKEAEEKLIDDYAAVGGELFTVKAETAWGESVTLSPVLDELDFLKVAHHGSSSSSSESFLSLVQPEAAFISAGTDNSYGHPSVQTLERLHAAGADIYRTDESGSIVLTISRDGTYQIETLGR